MNIQNENFLNSVGIVEKQYHTFNDFTFLNGETLKEVTICYETYGTLNEQKNNAILITHALSGNSHAAGYYSKDDKYAGWWDLYIGPDKTFDTNKYYIIASNVIGGCDGSSGPGSVDPDTKQPYCLNFPNVTIHDMVTAQKQLIDHLGINKLFCVAGGSMGGMQALKWSIIYPEKVASIIAIATSPSLSAQGIALNEVGRQAIINDINWNNGDYYGSHGPNAGLSLARMIGHITYLSEKHMHEKFGRRLQDSMKSNLNSKQFFQVESYLHYQGDKFVSRFDANSYIYITRAIDYFDLTAEYGSLAKAFENIASNNLIISFSSDWLYPSSQAKEIVRALRINGKNVIYTDIETDNGHDAFLIKNETLEKNISNFLKREYEKI